MEGVELARMMADYLQQAIQKRVEANGDLPCMICDNELMKNGVTGLWEDELTENNWVRKIPTETADL